MAILRTLHRVVSIKETSKGVWRVSYDGHPLGDSRGYDKARAWAEAQEVVRQELGWATRDRRHAELTLGEKP